MIIRVRSRDGLERVTLPEEHPPPTISSLASLIESQLGVPVASQFLSRNHNLLLAKTPNEAAAFAEIDFFPFAPLSSLGISHGSVVFLTYFADATRAVAGAPRFTPAGTFGRKMTMEDLIACQVRVSRQENPHCDSASFDRGAANAFQLYVNETLAFSVNRGGFMYGSVGEGGAVSVDFIYEPPQQGTEDELVLLRDPREEALVEAVAAGLGMRRVGFVFAQSVGRKAKGEYTLSASEVLQAAELQAEGGIQEWVTALVKLEVNDNGCADVHFEAFQLSDICVKLFKDGWFLTDVADGNPAVSVLKKDVVVGVKDMREIDNDFFLVPVKITDHEGLLSSSFPVENRMALPTQRHLMNHLDRTKHFHFVKRISDFHLLLLLAKVLDINADVPALTECVRLQAPVPEGYQFLIESLAAAGGGN